MVAEGTKVSEYDQEMPQSHTTVEPETLRCGGSVGYIG